MKKLMTFLIITFAHVLELALASHSQYIVTFNVKDFSNVYICGIEIVKPSEFLNILGERW